MTAKSTAIGAITVHRLKSGATVQLYLSANKSLYQIVDTAAKSVSPTWKGGAGPVITPILIGGEMSNAKWYLNMPAGTPSSNRETYNILTVKAGKVSVNGTTGALTFTDNIITAEQTIQNQVLTFICEATAGGSPTEIQRTVVIDVRSGGNNSYWGHIEADKGTTLGKRYDGDTEPVTSTVLKPKLTLGITELKSNQFSVIWKKTGGNSDGTDQEITSAFTESLNGLALGADNSLIVYRDGVDGSAHFEAHFMVGGVEVEAEGIQIADNADTYFVNVSGPTSVYSDSPNNGVTLVARVYETQTNKLITAVKSWSTIVTDAERMREYIKDEHYTQLGTSGETCELNMVVGKMYVPNTKDGAFVDSTKPWIKCGDSASADEAVATPAEATECDVIVQFMAML